MFDTKRIKKGQEARYVKTVRVMLFVLGALAAAAGAFDLLKEINPPLMAWLSLLTSLLLIGSVVIFLVLANMMVDKKKAATRVYRNEQKTTLPRSAFEFDETPKKKHR